MHNQRILMVANTASMIKLFNIRNIRILQSMGYQVFVAANFTAPGTISTDANQAFKTELTRLGVRYFDVKFRRGIGNPVANRRLFNQLCQIVDQYQITAIHTHAPLSSVICRRVAHHMGIKCLYTSHGFQFFPGGPLKSWLLFFPIEWYYAHYTNALITINSDDYRLAKRYLPAKRVYYIPGVGTDIQAAIQLPTTVRQARRQKKRAELGLKATDFMILSVGELSKRKNHETVLRAIAKVNDPQIKYVVAGIGPQKERLLTVAKKLGVSNQLRLLGFRTDIEDLYLAADLNAFISRREGLGMGGLDGVAHGLYIIASATTGAKDYVFDDQTGILIKRPLDVDEVAQAIKRVMFRQLKGRQTDERLLKFDQSHVDDLMRAIYKRELLGGSNKGGQARE